MGINYVQKLREPHSGVQGTSGKQDILSRKPRLMKSGASKGQSSSALGPCEVLGWEAIKLDMVGITVQKDPSEWVRGMGLEAGIPRVSLGACSGYRGRDNPEVDVQRLGRCAVWLEQLGTVTQEGSSQWGSLGTSA